MLVLFFIIIVLNVWLGIVLIFIMIKVNVIGWFVDFVWEKKLNYSINKDVKYF